VSSVTTDCVHALDAFGLLALDFVRELAFVLFV
jgi:hypothetical protein